MIEEEQEGGQVIGVCGRCKELIRGPIETRHNGHCGACERAVYGTPAACECGQSFGPQPAPAALVSKKRRAR